MKFRFPNALLAAAVLALLQVPCNAFAKEAGVKAPIVLSPDQAQLEKADGEAEAAPLVATADSDGCVCIKELQPDEGAQTTWVWNVVVPEAGKWNVAMEYRGAGGLEVSLFSGKKKLATVTSATAGGRLLEKLGALDLPKGKQTFRVRVVSPGNDPAKTIPAHGVELRDPASGPVTRPDFRLGGLALTPAAERRHSSISLRVAIHAAKPRSIPSQLWLPAIFGDGLVLQRGKVVPVWGRCRPGSTVTVSFREMKATAKADAAGRWMARLQPMQAAADPAELHVSDEESSLLVRDVLVGEVWFGSGQSNMEVSVYKWSRNREREKEGQLFETDDETKDFIAQKDFSQIRISAVTRDHSQDSRLDAGHGRKPFRSAGADALQRGAASGAIQSAGRHHRALFQRKPDRDLA